MGKKAGLYRKTKRREGGKVRGEILTGSLDFIVIPLVLEI
jgi:hypothetical protein